MSFAGSFSGRLKGLWSAGCAALMLCALAPAKTAKSVPAEKTATTHSSASKATTKSKSKKSKKKKTSASTRRGQKNIDPQRAQAIQEALIREHYLDGKATGVWDNDSQKAMERFQADNKWQSKTVPDSRALIKLGLGPDHEHLLNPESAMTMTMAPSSPRMAPPASSSTMDSSGPSRPQK